MMEAVTLTAGALITLAAKEFLKTGAGELAKQFTAESCQKIPILWQTIKARLTGRSEKVNAAIAKVEEGDETGLETLRKNLDVLLDEDPAFAQKLRALATEIQQGQMTQVGLASVTAGELDAEVAQRASAQGSGDTSQTGATGINVDGKATIKIRQDID